MIFVDLAAVRDSDLVVPVIAQTLGARDFGQQPAAMALEGFLRSRHLLLILDNFEQVSDAGVAVAALLQSCPRPKVIATSRMLLKATGELAMPVSPLTFDVSMDDVSAPDHLPISPSDAVRLIVDRTRAVIPDFVLSEVNEPAIAEIVLRPDGLPLAIELAAAHGTLLSPSDLLARLDHPLPHLTGGPGDKPARHQTMRAAIAWSYELLTHNEK